MNRIRTTAFLALFVFAAFVPSLSAAPPSGYYLVWDSEFNGSSLDTTKWGYRLPGAERDGYDSPNAISFNGSNLVITTYTSGGTNFTCQLYTEKKFESKYGYWESYIRWSDSNGTWSAFWMLPPSESFSAGSEIDISEPQVAGSEIDICEHRDVDSTDDNIANYIQVNLHYYDGSTTEKNDPGSPLVPSSGGLATGYHTYGFLWTSTAYSFQIDDSQVYTALTSPVSQSTEYALLDTAVDDTSTTWAGYIPSGGYGSQATSTTKMSVAYVRYYAPNNVLFWTGASSADWNNSANWVSNLSPTSTSDLTFSYLTTANLTMTPNQNYSIDGLIFLTSSGAFTINGANAITLGAGGVDMTAASENVTFNAPITIGVNQTWGVGVNRNNNAGLTLTDNGSISGSATLTKTCYGKLILNGANSFSGTLNVDSGSSSLNDGILEVTTSTAIANVASPIAIRNTGSGSSTLQFDVSSGGLIAPQSISLAGRSTNIVAIENVAGSNTVTGGLSLLAGGSLYLMQSDAGTLNLGGTISGGGATGALTLTLQGSGNFYISGAVQNGTASALGIVKTNGGALIFAGKNTYTGATTVAGGMMSITGSLAGGLTVESGCTISGNGTITGAATIQSGGTLSPGISTGALSFGGNLTLASGSTCDLEISAAVPTNGQVAVAGTVTYGGTLVVTNVAGTLAGGQSFKLFSAGSHAGSFASINLPPLNSGLAWNTNSLSNGILSVHILTPTIGAVRAGSNMVITYSGTLLSSTNVAGPYSPVNGATSPYTNHPPTTEFFQSVNYP